MTHYPVRLLCILALGAACPPLASAGIPDNASSSDPRPVLARRLVEMTTPMVNIRQGARQEVAAVYRASAQRVDQAQNISTRPPEAQAAANAVAEAEIDRFMDATAPALMDQSAQLYAGEMSAEQLGAAVAFYQTDAGRKLLMLIAENTGDQTLFKNRFEMELSPGEQAQVREFGQSDTGRLLAQIGEEASQVLTSMFNSAVVNEIPVIMKKTGEATQTYLRDHPQDAVRP